MALTDNLIGYWKLDGNSNDSLGVLNGTDSGSPTYAAGKIGDAVTYNGSSSYATIANNASLFPTALTVSLWIKFTTVQQNKHIFTLQNANSSPYAGFSIFVEDSANGKKVWSATRSTSFGYITSTNNLNDGNWHHILVTFDSGTHTLYVDGTQNAQNTGKTLAWDTGADLQFGKFYNYSGGYYDGSLDEVGYWSRALTGSEITELYNSGAGLTYPFSTSTSHIKSADGILLANIKSADGVANI